MCFHKGCKINPIFNYIGEKKGLYCFSHKLEEMINVKDKKCYHENCKTQPTFNFEGKTERLYCSLHKLDGMINVKDKTCNQGNCKTQPTFNFEGETTSLYCFLHKLDGMIDIKSKKCNQEGCKTQPTFNFEGKTERLYCSLHKLDGMIDIKSKKCNQEGCKTQPTFNFEGKTERLYCSLHKLDGMIDIKSKKINVKNKKCNIDIKHKTCNHENCPKQPIFNFEKEKKGLYCSLHKLDGMVDIKNKTCNYKNCKTRPTFNFEGEKKSLYCSLHKLEGMIDVKHQTCKNDWCFTRVQDKYEGYCLFCFIHMFPDKPVSRNYKTKEFEVVNSVKNHFPNLSWISDKKIQDGCSKRRPDLFLDLGYQILIIEIDENQHIDYDCSCENKRIMELSQDLGHRPIIFIRFNPDDYKKDNKNITSCWGYNKNGISVIKKSKKDEWNTRLNTLYSQIDYWTNPDNITNKTIETIQLFFDE